jgi:hypothetical protein
MVVFKQTGEWFIIYDRFDIYSTPDRKSNYPSYAWYVEWGAKMWDGWGNIGQNDDYGVSCINLNNMTGSRFRRDGNFVLVSALHPYKRGRWARKPAHQSWAHNK